LGGRGDAGLVSPGAERMELEAAFDAPEGDDWRELLAEEGLEPGEELILRRVIHDDGKGRCYVNGRMCTVGTLARLGEHLVDIHGQGGHLSLLRVREHLNFLDRYGGLLPLRQEVADLVGRLREVRSELQALRQDERELARRIDLLEYQIGEIEAAHLRPGEEEELLAERNRLAHAEELMALADEALTLLEEGSGEAPSVRDGLEMALRALRGLLRLDRSLETTVQGLEDLSYSLAEAAREVRGYREGVEFDPRRQRQVEERLGLIHSLKRKYGDSIEEILAYAEAARRELQGITHRGERIEELEAEEERLLREIGEKAARLSAARQEAASRLAAEVERHLADLHMERARFSVEVRQVPHPQGAWVGERRYAFDATGIDQVEFLVTANPGEPLRPLAKVASGGETSRLMLALKTVLTTADEIPSLIFDEIDVGVGGRTGGVVGQKLWRLTLPSPQMPAGHQVLCVTHLPQIAAFADAHFRVAKAVVGGRTVTRVERLEGEAVVDELAQMLGTETEATRESAQELWAQSQALKRQMAP
ncbi:MAG: DNA repair protein RecN, partial [Anaerolineae bacterium]